MTPPPSGEGRLEALGLKFAEGGLYFLIRRFDPFPFCDSWRSLG